ncbi:IS630 transposase-related protein [Eikenella sp. NML03-A-027]|uniref:IS630 transposase-related protein n=1 Tax=Eikenella sp. NML03-A-027 TaxID=1795828 RepID=UPI0009EF2970
MKSDKKHWHTGAIQRHQPSIQAYGVFHSALFSWCKRQLETEKLSITPNPRLECEINREELKEYIEQNPDIYLSEITK